MYIHRVREFKLHLAQDLRLYKVWVKFKEDEKDSEQRSMSIKREADVDNEADVLTSAPGPKSVQDSVLDAGPGVKNLKKKKDPKSKADNSVTTTKEKKEKTPAQQAKQARFG